MDNRRKIINDFLNYCRHQKVYLMKMNDEYGLDLEFANEMKIEDEFLNNKEVSK